MLRIAGATLAFLLTSGALAQAPPAAPTVPSPDPPYQKRLERLAEVLGALHYLRALCVPGESETWRREMAGLIDAEQPTPERRDLLVGAFNRGLGAFRETYRTCTPAARVAGDRYRSEGIALARDIAGRFAD